MRLGLTKYSAAVFLLVTGLEHLSSTYAGQWQARGPSLVAVDLHGVSFGDNRFIAVGGGGTVIKSENGRDWSVQSLNVADLLLGVGFGAGRYVAVGWNNTAPNYSRGVIWESPDGTTWTRRVNDGEGALTRVVYGNDRFVAVGGSGWLTLGGALAVSTNGIEWKHRGLDFPASYLKDVIFVGDRFLYGAYSGIFSSADGIDWTNTGAPLAAQIGLAKRDSLVVSVGRWGAVQRSTDNGLTWFDIPQTNNIGWFMDVAANDDLFVAVGDNGNIAISTDGLSWTNQASGTGALLEDVVYGAGVWVAVGRGGTILTSQDGRTWTDVSVPAPLLTDVTYGNGRFVAVGGDTIMRSVDGITWTRVANGSASGVTFANGIFVAVGASIQTSYDGEKWSISPLVPKWALSRVAYGAGQFVAVGGTDALNYLESVAYASEDGTNWMRVAVTGGSGNLDSLAYADGGFVASSSRSRFGGIATIGITTNVSNTFSGGAIPAGGLASGSMGLLKVESPGYVSVGGNNKSYQLLASYLTGCSFVDGHYLVFGAGFDGTKFNGSAIFMSEDGMAWRDISYPLDGSPRAACAGDGHLVMVGDGFIIERSLDDGLLESSRLNVQLVEDRVQLRWSSRVGHRYWVESSSTLESWEPVVTDVTPQPVSLVGTGGILFWETGVRDAARIYRLRITVE